MAHERHADFLQDAGLHQAGVEGVAEIVETDVAELRVFERGLPRALHDADWLVFVADDQAFGLAVLKYFLQHRQSKGLIVSYKDEPVRIVKRSWKTALKNAQLRHVRFHDLRHTFNTRLMEAGVLQEVRMALMGHSSGSKVHATYTHIELPVKREAIQKLEQWVKDQQKQTTRQRKKEKPDAITETDRTESESGLPDGG